jgi:hypothetical protein
MGAPTRSNPVRVRDVLVAAVPELRERMLEEEIRNDWTRVVGPVLSGRSRPGQLRAGSLDVTVDNSPWLQELTLRSSEILSALQHRYGGAVTSLRFTLGTVHTSPPRARTRPRPSVPASLRPDEARLVERMVDPVADPALAASLRRLLTKDVLGRRASGPRHRGDASSLQKEDS